MATALADRVLAPMPALAAVFTDVTAGAGINHLQNVGNAPGAGLFRTGGAAAADYDNDGWVDLFVTRLNARPLLYRNLGNGTFQDVAPASGFTLELAGQRRRVGRHRQRRRQGSVRHLVRRHAVLPVCE